MSSTVCLAPPDTLYYPEGGGHMWVFLNWALGLRELGCRVIWLEEVKPNRTDVRADVATLKSHLERYGLAACVALCSRSGEPLAADLGDGCMDLDAAAEADLLINSRYNTAPEVVDRFRRSVLLDIDPGLLQMWTSSGQVALARHDAYFTIGETVGQPTARFPDLGLKWNYTPPCVALSWWPRCPVSQDGAFTTVGHWYAGAWLEDNALEDKRSGFLPFLDLPRYTDHPLELALDLEANDPERAMLHRRGWRVCDAHAVAATPWDYQRYIQRSRAEFSCVKPSCIRLQNAWISDRTICYLASGRPAVVQYTGPSRYLPDAAGLFRFRDLPQAARYVTRVVNDNERQSALARALAEKYFDARKVVASALERALA